MWIAAWTFATPDHGADYWVVTETEAEAMVEIEKIIDHDHLHCWAIAPIAKGSEPHYTQTKA